NHILNYKAARSLTLYLGVYSPSDTKYVLRDFRLEDSYPYRLPKDSDGTFNEYEKHKHIISKLNDPLYRWNNGYQARPSLGARKRLLGSRSLHLNFKELLNQPKDTSYRFPGVEKVVRMYK